ncbi:MAG: alcohol dehydrogenase catalytic domain-containing protein [Polaromonas sp.]|nr:alcohol dehydrogenase catalytic domain-containing protein [Polaromonas sp.]
MNTAVRSCEALTILGPERVEFARVDVPEPGQDQVLIEVSACGICGSDLRLYRQGEMEPAFFGHEFSGKVVSVGKGVEDFKIGDRIAAGLAHACGHCEPCQRGFPNYCLVSANQYNPGGFAQYSLANCAQGFRPIIKIPDAIDDVRATLFEPLSCAMRIATRVAVARGSRVLVLGLGMMGMLAALLLKKSTPDVCIIGADTSADRIAQGRDLGLDECVQLEPGKLPATPIMAPSFDLVIDATGIAAVFRLAVDLAGLGGTVILGGVPAGVVDFAPLPIFRKELTVVGAKGPFPYLAADGGSQALDLLLSAEIPWEKLVTVFPFRLAAEAFQGAARSGPLKSVLVR